MQKLTMRLLTCGSVDDGKSTLVGRLLYESRNIYDDQLEALKNCSKRYGTRGPDIDFALLVDGLRAEREQGITIDVAYRYFTTNQRRYIIADAPGHAQYTRNMATGASTADLAILLVDARKGLLMQTRRHHRIVSLMGVRQIVLAVNKMDLVGFDRHVFQKIESEYRALIQDSSFEPIQAIPISATNGDNIVHLSKQTSWYDGPCLLDYLDSVEIEKKEKYARFSMPIQWVNRSNTDYRGYAGRVSSGIVSIGDAIRILPSGVRSKISGIALGKEALSESQTGDSITLSFEHELDASRGDLVVAQESSLTCADHFQARVLWLSEEPLLPGRSYRFKIHSKEVSATVTQIKFREDIQAGAHLAATTLTLNEIAVLTLSLNGPVVFEPYSQNRTLGSFILIDKLTNSTAGAGMIEFALNRSANIQWQKLDIQKAHRAKQKAQKPLCIWFTGLSGSGKSTIANLLEQHLHAEGTHTYLLDGDNIRHGLNRDLGFTDADRVENIRRLAEVAKLMVDAGLVVLVSSISPFRAERQLVREMFEPGEYVEIFVDAPLEVCKSRDPKGLYEKARRGELKNLSGIDSAYERPINPEISVDTTNLNIDETIRNLVSILKV